MLKLLLTLPLAALALEGYAEEKKTHSGKIIVGDSSEYTYSNSSEANRQSLRYGLGVSGTLGHGRYSAFYYLNPDLAFEFFSRSIRDTVDEDLDDWDRKEKAYGISASFFTKDAWFFRLGLLNRQAVFTADRYNSIAETWINTYDIRISQHDIAGELAIGTQWQWSSFYFGFDWLCYEHRLTKLNSSTSLIVKDPERIRANYAESYLEKGRVADNDLNKKDLYMSARIGWSF
jgi:hypothetical protein